MKRAIADGRMFAFLGMHPGIQDQAKARDSKDKERVRGMAARLVRIFAVLALFLQARAPVILILPWGSAEATIKESELDRKIHRQVSIHRYVDSSDLQYEIISNCDALRGAADLHSCLRLFLYSAAGLEDRGIEHRDPQVQHEVEHPRERRAHDDRGHGDDTTGDYPEREGDLIRPVVQRPYRLAGDAELTQRHQENLNAISGMRNPARSLKRVPGHKNIGERISAAIGKLLDEEARIQEDTLRAIGNKTKKQRGPSDEAARKANNCIREVLRMQRDGVNSTLIYI